MYGSGRGCQELLRTHLLADLQRRGPRRPAELHAVAARWCRIREEERGGQHRRRSRLLAAAAVLLVIVGSGSALAGRASAPSVVVAAPVAATDQPPGRLVTGSNGQIGAAAVVTPAAGWVRITLTATGLPPGERCSVVVIARDGTEATAATWVVPQAGGQGTTINGSASVPNNEIATIAIRDQTDTPLVSMPV